MEMESIRALIEDRLIKLGYTVTNPEIGRTMTAAMDGFNNMEWEIRGAGQKAFEVLVFKPNKDDFTYKSVPLNESSYTQTVAPNCDDDPKSDNHGKWFIDKRFKRDSVGVRNFLIWLGSSVKANQHLTESLTPVTSPQAIKFNTTEYDIVSGYVQGGVVQRAKVVGMAALEGTKLVSVDTPDSHPWFIIELQSSYGRSIILTDSDEWYPVVQHHDEDNSRSILMAHGMASVLKNMNKRDRELISKAIEHFVSKFEQVV